MKKLIFIWTVIVFLPIFLQSKNTCGEIEIIIFSESHKTCWKNISYYDSLKNRHSEISKDVYLLKNKEKSISDTLN
jgi:hypothetical protein